MLGLSSYLLIIRSETCPCLSLKVHISRNVWLCLNKQGSGSASSLLRDRQLLTGYIKFPVEILLNRSFQSLADF